MFDAPVDWWWVEKSDTKWIADAQIDGQVLRNFYDIWQRNPNWWTNTYVIKRDRAPIPSDYLPTNNSNNPFCAMAALMAINVAFIDEVRPHLLTWHPPTYTDKNHALYYTKHGEELVRRIEGYTLAVCHAAKDTLMNVLPQGHMAVEIRRNK